jgi:hypothetical protein
MNMLRLFYCTLLLLGYRSFLLAADHSDVELKSLPDQGKVEIRIAGHPFTDYCYGPAFEEKPVFYPVMSPKGVVVNREIPFDNEALRKEQDHPHHQSLFFGYGDLDGADFWTCREGERMVHRAFLEASGGKVGKLSVLIDWLDPQGRVAVHEVKRVTFGGARDVHWMDHDIRLTAPDEPRSFEDTKEGMFALRVADALREDEGSGRYINAYGWETADQIWGKRAPWVALRGTVGGNDVTIAIFDHPASENHPSYWHARAYGLFSINPFGRKDFVEGASPDNRKLQSFETFHFRHRVLVYDGKVSKQRLDQDYWEYVK